ncbi:MAG: DEAD/DEAH box helicase [Bacillota bacterium]
MNPVLLNNVRRLGYVEPTPIQTSSIPPVLAGLDVVATAETGSGKTAAFLLPLYHRLLLSRQRGKTRGLILCPTREIALQTHEEAEKIGRNTGLNSTAIYGGVGFEPQMKALKKGADIVVATPGRLLDHAGRQTIRFQDMEILVLDEADRMLDMGFLPDIKRILQCLPASRQTLLYSATMPQEIQALADRLMKEPARIAVGRPATPPGTVVQVLYHTSHQEKTWLLTKLLPAQWAESALVFTRTKHRADRLTRQLIRAGFGAACIHGNRTQRQRETALDGFRRGRFRVLVATDIAARGLDVQGVTHVINYDLPPVADDYVHRIGRTARAGASGCAVSLVTDDDMKALAQIEKGLGYRIRLAATPTADTATGERQSPTARR